MNKFINIKTILVVLAVIIIMANITFSVTGVPVLVLSQNGTFTIKSSFASAVSADDTVNKTLYVMGYTPITGTVTVPANKAVKAVFGGYFGGVGSLVFNGPFEGSGYVFRNTGTVSGLKILCPEWRGADATDALDDLAALNKTTADAMSNGDGGATIRLGIGTYKTTDHWIVGNAAGYTNRSTNDPTATITSNINIVGEGRNTVIDGAGHNHSVVVFYKCLSCSISNVKIVGNPTVAGEDLFLASGIELIDCAHTDVYRAYIFDIGRTSGWIAGIYISSSIYCEIYENRVNNTANGINIDNWYTANSIHTGTPAVAKYNNVHHNIATSPKWGFVIDGSSCQYNSLEDNKTYASTQASYAITNGSYNAVIRNLAVGSLTHGFQGSAVGGATPTGNVVAHNRFLSSLSMGMYLSTDADGASAFSDWLLNNNIVAGNAEHGISLRNITKSSICANQIYNNGKSGIHTNAAANSANLMSQIVLAGNNIHNNGWHGMLLYNLYYSNLGPNNIVNNGTATNNTYASIYLDGGSAKYNIFGPNILGNGGGTGVKHAFDFSATVLTGSNLSKNIATNNLSYASGTSFANTGFAATSNIVANNIEDDALKNAILRGGFDPEGAITGDPGSIYLNTAGAAGNVFHVKESGTGNTGWVGK